MGKWTEHVTLFIRQQNIRIGIYFKLININLIETIYMRQTKSVL